MTQRCILHHNHCASGVPSILHFSASSDLTLLDPALSSLAAPGGGACWLPWHCCLRHHRCWAAEPLAAQAVFAPLPPCRLHAGWVRAAVASHVRLR